MEILELTNDELDQVSGGAFGDWSISCCEGNFFGVNFSFELFSYSGTYSGAGTQYKFNRASAYNRL
ncbi:bacteriocin [Alteromonas sp. ASW11-130]|uniref:bacteriocin n=1 Tax=Alteromonas sp. ASW11-130 TaxID=3015775 RepID=UPI0022426E6A|nr:bacteriocin [Alteromonas sp. ASW11-130]MCW8091128.1 bacteriocin [Alteromonas sp. ASW11-130]